MSPTNKETKKSLDFVHTNRNEDVEEDTSDCKEEEGSYGVQQL